MDNKLPPIPKKPHVDGPYEAAQNIQVPGATAKVPFTLSPQVMFRVDGGPGEPSRFLGGFTEPIDLGHVSLHGPREDVYQSLRRIMRVAEEERDRLERVGQGYRPELDADAILSRREAR